MLNQVIFYYQLKSIVSDHGFLSSKTIINQTSILKLSQSSIWRKVDQLVTCGLLIKHSNGYRLVSYNQLYNILGYDMTYNVIKKRLGCFKIHKIVNYTIHSLKYVFAFIDIRDNMKRQMHNAWKNLRKDSRYAESKLHCGTRRQKLQSLCSNNVRTISLNDETQYIQQLCESLDKHSDYSCNPDITLSLKGICRVLGISSTQTAFNIISNLKRLELMDSLNRFIFVETTDLSLDTFHTKYDRRYYQLGPNGIVLRRITNKLTVTGVL